MRIAVRALAGSIALVSCATSPAVRGPLPVRNQHPAQLTVLHLDPVAARAVLPGEVTARVATAYSSLFQSGSGNGNQFTMDGELLRASLQLRVGVGEGFTVGAELPWELTTGGFLDHF